MNDPHYVIGESQLTIADVVRASRGPVHLALTSEARARMAAARAVVDDHIGRDAPVYGLNTGLGASVGNRFEGDELARRQEQVIRARVVGVGDLLPPETCRAALFCRTVALAHGGAGVSPEVHSLMMAMLERDVIPAIPSIGSVGAGDLGLMMSVAAVMIGRGEARHGGELMPGAAALSAAGLQPVTFGAKDGLAVGNSSALSCAMACLALEEAGHLLAVHVAVAALAFEAYAANPRIFDARLAGARPASGQEDAAGLFRRALEGGGAHEGGGARHVQDALSFRTLAPVTGTYLTALREARRAVEVELNAASDNPLVLVETAEIHSTANFHTPALALAFDTLAIASTYLATASSYRSMKLMTERLSGLPNYLAPAGGAAAGLVPMQKTISALHAGVRLKANPASLDGLPVSDAVEDLTPQTQLAICKFEEQLDLMRWLVSIEAFTAAQAWDLREAAGTGGRLGVSAREVYGTVRSVAPFMVEDRETGPEVTALHRVLWSEPAVSAVESSLGGLEPVT